MSNKVLFDVDTGCDDATMLLTALADDGIDVAGVTTVFGNAPLEHTTRNTRAILEYVDKGEIPVAQGCARPFVEQNLDESPADIEQIHGETGLTAALPAPETVEEVLDDRHAARFMIDMAREHDDLTIAAVGPQTNLALALAMEPRLPQLLDELYVMGGAAMVGGNVRPTAEFNFYQDPEAAARVLESGSVKMVGLDVTEQTHIPLEEIERLADEAGPHRTFAGILDYYPEDSLDRYGYDGPVVHDSVVAADLIDGVLDYEDHYVAVSTHDRLTAGQTVTDDRRVLGREPNTAVAVDIDVERYQSIVLDRLRSLANAVA